MQSITIDRNKHLKDEPHLGHNRWHPDIPPVLEVAPGEEAVLETRDSADGRVRFGMTPAELGPHGKWVHPLTGPLYVNGAVPGDLLEVEYLDIQPQPYGWTRCGPTGGLLRDLFQETYVAHWELQDGWATSPQIPGVRIPNGAFMGTAGVAPSHSQLTEWAQREAAFAARGGVSFPPDAAEAVPNADPIAGQGLRTIPPRENGGNLDVKQLTKGSRLLLPVNVPGALYSVGDGHFAQGDGECCLTAIEMGATVAVRFRIHQGEAARHHIRWPRIVHPDYFLPPEWAAPRNCIATVGMPVQSDGAQQGEDHLTLAARNAVLNMIDLLQERGWSREQAYVICSVAVDLKISNLVDLPNITVSAFLPEDIFQR